MDTFHEKKFMKVFLRIFVHRCSINLLFRKKKIKVSSRIYDVTNEETNYYSTYSPISQEINRTRQ